MKQLSKFLTKLKEVLIDENSYNIVGYWGMQKKIKNWPTIEYKDGGYAPDDTKHDGELVKETLDLENFEPLFLDNNRFVFYAGGDWQYPYTVTVKLKDDRLTVTDSHPYKKGEYKELKRKDLIKILQAEDILEAKKDKEALKDAQHLIDKTKNTWSSKNVNSIIKQIKDSDEYIKNGTWTLIKKYLEELIPKELEIKTITEKLENLTNKKVKFLIKEELPKDDTEEGKLLIAALAKITTESQTDKTPDEVFDQVKELKTQIYNSSQNNKKSVVGIIIKNNQILLGEAVTDDDRNGWLCFPGGGVDEGESLLRAVKREIREEVNILASFDPNPITDTNRPNVYFFVGKYINGSIQYNAEFKNMSWYDLNNLPINKIFPQNVLILNKIKDRFIFKNNNKNLMKDQILIVKEGKGYNQGTIIESYIQTKKGILTGKQFIPKSDFVFLNEKLSSTDQEEVRKIVRGILQKFMWRMYTRSSFLISENENLKNIYI